MKINLNNFTNVETPKFLVLEIIDNNLEHLKNEIKRLEHLKKEVKYELEYGEGWSVKLYQLLQRL